jgi:hypothetical protein
MADDTEALRAAATNLLHALERVFHSDWTYTKSELGITDGDPNARAFLARLFGETDIPVRSEGPKTFLCPGRSIADLEDNNWGNYVGLLKAYNTLCAVVGHANACEQHPCEDDSSPSPSPSMSTSTITKS